MIHPGSYWTHKHDGYEVKIEPDEDLVDKAPADASWHAALAYRRTDKDDSPKYVRRVDDFMAKFEPVPEEKAVA